jgi:hypothetical protein
MINPDMRLTPIARGEIRFRPAADGGRKTGAPPGPSYLATVLSDPRQAGEDLPTRIMDAEGHLSAEFGFGRELSDGWRATDIGFIAPELIKDDLVPGSRWLIMEGPRVVGELKVTTVSTD